MIRRSLLFVAFALSLAGQAHAGDARALIKQVLSRASWQDMTGEVSLTLKNKRGETKERRIKLWSKKNANNENSMLMRFEAPADVRGTGFLLIEHRGADDDRRLFLPALRRVNRISASGSGGNFMSSDFTYYDIGRPDLEEWQYSFAGNRKVDGVRCTSVSGVAASGRVKEDTGYAKIVWHVDPQRLIASAADYYDKHGKLFKSMQALRVEQVSGTPFATHLRMKDHATGHVSELVFSKLKTNQGLPERTFSERNLRQWTR